LSGRGTEQNSSDSINLGMADWKAERTAPVTGESPSFLTEARFAPLRVHVLLTHLQHAVRRHAQTKQSLEGTTKAVLRGPKTSDFGGLKDAQSAATAQGLTGGTPMGFLADACASR
jgi:hypothetical protein